jgi:tetratricopeptide (TPR) repeat protein
LNRYGTQRRAALSLLKILALSALSSSLSPAANVPNEAHRRGVALYREQKYADAIAALQEAIKTEPPETTEHGESALLIGQSYFVLHDSPKAIPWLEQVTSVNEANYMLGYAYLQTGRQDRSVEAFARLFRLKPGSAAAHLLAGQMMLKEQYQFQALAEVSRALELDPNIPHGHFLLGEIALYRESLTDALAQLQKELKIDPNFSMAWYRLGDAYARQQNFDLAIPNLERAVWLNPDYSGPYILLGKCYFRQRKYSQAEKILRGALRVDPKNRQAIYLLGQTLVAAGRQVEGYAILKKLQPVTSEAESGGSNP